MGLLAERQEEYPRAYQTVLLLAGLVLLAITIARLALSRGGRPRQRRDPDLDDCALRGDCGRAGVVEIINWPICALVSIVAGR